MVSLYHGTSIIAAGWRILGLLFFTSLISFAQSIPTDPKKYKELGIPYIQNYSPKEYGASGNNYGVLQSDEGLMYFGNEDGILEYDGVSWRLINVPNQGLVRSLAQDENNRIYVGAIDDLGYLKPDLIGRLSFLSLKSELPPHISTFGTVWEVHPTKQGIYFNTQKYLLLWSNNEFQVWENPSKVSTTFLIGERLFIYQSGVGLSVMEGHSLSLVTSEEAFGGSIAKAILPYGNNKFLIATEKTGLFILDGNTIIPFEPEISEYLKRHFIFHGAVISAELLAFGTFRGGLVIMDKTGVVRTVLTKEMGLRDNTIVNTYLDAQGQLWLSTNDGISRIEVSTPLSIYNERQGIKGGVNAFHRHQDTIYVSTSQGLFFLKAHSQYSMVATFQPVTEINRFTFKGISFGNRLLVPSWVGVYEIKAGIVKKLNDYQASCIYQSKIDANRFYLGLKDGLASLYYKNNNWLDEGTIEAVDDDIRKIVETPTGTLWVQPQIEGVWKVQFPMINPNQSRDNKRDIPVAKRFDSGNGLPEGAVLLYNINNKVLFKINKKSYQYNSKSDSLVLNPAFTKELGVDSGSVSRIVEDGHGNVWMWVHPENEQKSYTAVAIKQGDNSYRLKKILPGYRITPSATNVIYPEPNGLVWFGGTDGIVRYDSMANNKYGQRFNTLIRKVRVNSDSLLYAGAGLPLSSPKLSHSDNFLHFEYASTSFDPEAANRYQYKLEGFDGGWSDWTAETKKEYSYLPGGAYQFHVRAKNVYGLIGKEGSYQFKILPPWYRTWWAYFLYALIFIGFIWTILSWRARKLKVENEALERLVAERTEEVRDQAEQLKKQATKLKELDRVKSRFFANISHEFRTPLTLILGPLKDRLKQNLASQDQQEVSSMHRNAERLQRLINQLLDLTKIESHGLKLQVCHGNIHFFLRAILSSFSSHAQQRNIQYETLVPEQELLGYFDPDKLEKIIYNLVSNAFKFTTDGGKVTVSTQWKSGILNIEVTDSGCGIPADQLAFVFDRFYQTDDSNTRKHEGTGIGLALTKELVSLHKGNIEVTSILERGSTFIVTIPLDASAYEDHEILKDAVPLPVIAEIEPEVNGGGFQYGETGTEGDDAPIVLVVEDHEDLRHYINKHLSNYQVIEAADGADGLKTAIKYIPDLIISDVMMPIMGGIDLLQALKTNEKTSHIPVILLTAKADLPSKLEGFETGADDYLTKPFDAQELLSRCENLIKQRILLRNKFTSTLILKPKDIAITSTDEIFLNKVMETMEKHLDDSSFSVETFQREVGMSRMQLHRKLKALTDYSTTEFIRVQRLKRAAQLLADSDASISDISYRVGFNSLSYFTKCFKEQYGMTPSDYAFANDK